MLSCTQRPVMIYPVCWNVPENFDAAIAGTTCLVERTGLSARATVSPHPSAAQGVECRTETRTMHPAHPASKKSHICSFCASQGHLKAIDLDTQASSGQLTERKPPIAGACPGSV